MARIPFTYVATGVRGGLEYAVANATVTIYEADGTTLLAQSLWNLPTSGSAQANPTTTGANGATPTFWLDSAQTIVVKWTALGWAGVTETLQVGVTATLAAGSATGAVLGTDVAKLVAGKLSPASQATQVLASTDLTDVATASTATSDQLVIDSNGKIFNIGQRKRLKGYRSYVSGAADNSTAINAMIADIVSAGRGSMEFPCEVVNCKNVELLQTNAIVDLNGALLTLPSGAAATDDVVRSASYTTLSGTNANTSSGTPAPYNFTLMHGMIDTGAGLGRSPLMIFGMHYRLQHLTLIGQGNGPCLRSEYGTNSEDWLTGPSYRKGDTSAYVHNVTLIDNSAPSTSGYPSAILNANDVVVGVTGVTNATNPQITTGRPHRLRVGMTVVIASVVGATGVNGTWTVTTLVDNLNFTITTAAPGAYTSGGTVSYHVSAALEYLGPHDSAISHLYAFYTGSVQAARRGLLFGSNGSGSCTGTHIGDAHVYNNFDVGCELLVNVFFSGLSQIEGAYKANVWLRKGGLSGGGPGRSRIPQRIFNGHAGVTGLAIWDSNHSVWDSGIMHQLGQGEALTSGFPLTAIEAYNNTDMRLSGSMEHDYNIAITAARGTRPTNSTLLLDMDSYNSGTVTADWGTVISASHWNITQFPTGGAVTFA